MEEETAYCGCCIAIGAAGVALVSQAAAGDPAGEAGPVPQRAVGDLVGEAGPAS